MTTVRIDNKFNALTDNKLESEADDMSVNGDVDESDNSLSRKILLPYSSMLTTSRKSFNNSTYEQTRDPQNHYKFNIDHKLAKTRNYADHICDVLKSKNFELFSFNPLQDCLVKLIIEHILININIEEIAGDLSK